MEAKFIQISMSWKKKPYQFRSTYLGKVIVNFHIWHKKLAIYIFCVLVNVTEYYEEIQGNLADVPVAVAAAAVNEGVDNFLLSLGIEKV